MTVRSRRMLGAMIVAAAAAAVRCGTSRPAGPAATSVPPAPGATPSPSPASAAPVPTGVEAQAALLELEDRRAFDEPLLAALARSGEPGIRSRVALALGRVGDSRGDGLLSGLLRDGSPEVRSTAAFAASLAGGRLGSELVPLLSDPDAAVAGSAGKAIGFLNRPEGEEPLAAAAIREGVAPELRAVFLRSLWRFANPASEAILLRYAADPDSRVRSAAIFALARKPQAASRAALTVALGDGDPDTAAAAARALGLLASPESIEPLTRALGGRPPVVINALTALDAVLEKNPDAALPDDRRARVVELSSNSNTNMAVPAIFLLRRLAVRDREAFRRLWAIALSGEGRRRQVAILSLAFALGSGAEAALTAAAGSPPLLLRAAAADAAGSLPLPDARAWRERFALDRDLFVRFSNLASLKTAEAVRDVRPIVNSALTDTDPGVRSAAVDALALLVDPSLLPLFADVEEKARGDQAPDVAISVIGACEALHAEPGAAALVEGIARHGRTLPARLALHSLAVKFGRALEPGPAPEYPTEKTRADYVALLAEAKRPWRARVETAAGGWTIRLAGESAPMTVMNFVTLARAGYFDGAVIHRVVPNFVLQDGDPTGTGNGGPGWEIRDELNPLEYERGTVGMALSGPDTGGSQWFVTHSPQPHLNGIYTIFGHVVEGQSTVERIPQGERIVRVTVSAENP